MSSRRFPWIFAAAISGFLAVALGAFGAHALASRVDASLLEAYRTGVLYHLVHSVAILGCGLFLLTHDERRIHHAAGYFLAGIVLFSGSLYIMTVTGARWLGAVTPFGGIAFLSGWVQLAVAGWRVSRRSSL
ncbi:MAG: DUF423 domain-containing protein [Bacteroidetes bacterium]|nr:DUF423 domain-containing protein [Bacteroidota bacterium]